MEASQVAIVTGANKGIGYAIVRGLCKQFKGDVYLTARSEDLGKAAVAQLEKEGFHPKFHQLDITDKASCEKLKQFIKQKYVGIDILINNAGMAFKVDAPDPFSIQAEVTIKTNYWGTLNVCDALFPLLKSHARVVNVSSFVSLRTLERCTDELRKELKACKTVEQLNNYMNKFVEDVKTGVYKKKGWPETAYGVSKVGVTLLSIIQQQDIDKDLSRQDIVINAVCPGFVATDMSSYKGPKTIDEGADTPIYAALLPQNIKEPRGQFISDRTVKEVLLLH